MEWTVNTGYIEAFWTALKTAIHNKKKKMLFVYFIQAIVDEVGCSFPPNQILPVRFPSF